MSSSTCNLLMLLALVLISAVLCFRSRSTSTNTRACTGLGADTCIFYSYDGGFVKPGRRIDRKERHACTRRTRIRTTTRTTHQSCIPYPSLLENNHDDDNDCIGPNRIRIGGRDIFDHIRFLDSSLRRYTGTGVRERMGITLDENNNNDDDEEEEIYKSICRNDRYVLISHGVESDPIYNYGNNAALQAFHRTWDELTVMPSSESVVAASVDETKRTFLMESVTTKGFVESSGFVGVRTRGGGGGDDAEQQPPYIGLVDAVVWNCYAPAAASAACEEKTSSDDKIDDDGNENNKLEYIGQAAFFDRQKCPLMDNADDFFTMQQE